MCLLFVNNTKNFHAFISPNNSSRPQSIVYDVDALTISWQSALLKWKLLFSWKTNMLVYQRALRKTCIDSLVHEPVVFVGSELHFNHDDYIFSQSITFLCPVCNATFYFPLFDCLLISQNSIRVSFRYFGILLNLLPPTRLKASSGSFQFSIVITSSQHS